MATSTDAAATAAPGRRLAAGRRAATGTAHRPSASLSLSQARRVALRAQGLDRPRAERAGPATMRQLQQVVDRLGLLQIDSVNVVARAHLVPTFSRIGPYDPALLDRAAGRAPRRLVETWAHEASYVPPETYALLGWRRRAYREYAWGSIREVPLTHSPLVADVLAMIADDGPLTASEVHARDEGPVPRDRTEWGWNWTAAKRVLEYLFFTGQVASARRNPQFERCYDLTERVLPPDVLAAPEPDDDDAVRALLRIAARAPPTCTPTPTCPAAPPAAPCSARSTRSCSSAAGSRSCSACGTASRSTCPRRSACTATTCCRSCAASA